MEFSAVGTEEYEHERQGISCDVALRPLVLVDHVIDIVVILTSLDALIFVVNFWALDNSPTPYTDAVCPLFYPISWPSIYAPLDLARSENFPILAVEKRCEQYVAARAGSLPSSKEFTTDANRVQSFDYNTIMVPRVTYNAAMQLIGTCELVHN